MHKFYPELTQSVIDGPEITEEGVAYKFRKSVGTKGNDRKHSQLVNWQSITV